jgi:hypothetical protein
MRFGLLRRSLPSFGRSPNFAPPFELIALEFQVSKSAPIVVALPAAETVFPGPASGWIGFVSDGGAAAEAGVSDHAGDDEVRRQRKQTAKRYVGERSAKCGVDIWVVEDEERTPLDPRHDLYFHSEHFEVGYLGSGPSQAALAICADALGDDALAMAVYMGFKFDHVAKFDKAVFEISEADVRAWAANQAVSA